MSRALTSATTLDQLKREARQWLKALRAGDAEARARLQRAHPSAPADCRAAARAARHGTRVRLRELGTPEGGRAGDDRAGGGCRRGLG